MPDQNPNNLTTEQQAEQERLEQQKARQNKPQIHSRPRELAKQAKAAYKHGREFINDPKAKARELGNMAKDRALKPIRDINEAGHNAINSGKNAVNAVKNAPANIAKKAQDTVDKGKKAVQAVKNAPQNIKKGIDTAKAGVQAAKVGLQAARAAGGLLAKGGAKAAIGAAAGAATAGVGTAALAAADAAAAAVKAGRKILKKFNADLIGRIEDKIWGAITDHFKRHWKAYVAGLFIFPTLIFVFAFTAVYIASNRGFDKDSPTGQADIASFTSISNSDNMTFEDDQLKDFLNQVKEGMVNPRLLKFLNTISKYHKINISAIISDSTEDPNIPFNPVQIKINSVDSIKCTNAQTGKKYQEFPINLNQGFDWKSLIPIEENLKNNVVCAIDYYPLIDSPTHPSEIKLYETFSPQEFSIATIESNGLAAAQIKIAELLIEADNYIEDDEGIILTPASMELGSNLANKNFKDASDISLREYFKARPNKNIEDVDSLFQSPSSLSDGALVLFL